MWDSVWIWPQAQLQTFMEARIISSNFGMNNLRWKLWFTVTNWDFHLLFFMLTRFMVRLLKLSLCGRRFNGALLTAAGEVLIEKGYGGKLAIV